MPTKCCVLGCSTRAERDDYKLFRFPVIRSKRLRELSERRQKAWLKAINVKGLEKNKLKYTQVCSKHFISGRSADIKDELNPDWVPSLHLGYNSRMAQPHNRLNRFKRSAKRSALKSELTQMDATKTSPICTVDEEKENDLTCGVDEPTPNFSDSFSQTEDFHLKEAADEAMLKKLDDQAQCIARLKEELNYIF